MINFNVIEENVNKHNKERVTSNYFLGSICGVWNGSEKLWGFSTGFANLDKTKYITDKTIFRIASMTKPVTCCAFMQLFEKGKIGLDDSIGKWLPEFNKLMVARKIYNNKIISVNEVVNQITPRMLLTHTSGIGSGNTYIIQNNPTVKEKSLEFSVENYAKCVLEFEPGTKKTYSGIWAFDIIARLVEIISDMPFYEYINTFILKPLGMIDTTYSPNDEQISRCVDFVTRTQDGIIMSNISKKAGMPDWEDGTVGGGAGLFSTISDYSKFSRMLLNYGKLNAVRILSDRTIKLMATPQLASDIVGMNECSNWGLSMRVCTKQINTTQPLPINTFGWSGAFGTHFWVDRANEITCIYMMNLSNGGGSGEVSALEFEKDVMSGIC